MSNTINNITPIVASAQAAAQPPQAEQQKPAAASKPAAEPVSATELADAVQQINDFIQIVRRDLQFGVDEPTGHIVVTVRDSDSQEVVRQIPSEEVLQIARNLGELRGLLLNTRA